MFCDLVGYTAMSGQLDPEELRDVLRVYRQVCRSAVEHFGGFVARYVGDGIKIYFGYPIAQGNDAPSAVRAALQIVDRMKSLDGQGAGRQVRIGIHTGLVVTGDLLEGEGEGEKMAVIGEAPNIAARVQSLAEPNGVVITGATLRLLGSEFVTEDLGAHVLKGVTDPVRIHSVVKEVDLGGGAECAGRIATPLIGREEEWGTLVERWENARAGSGQVVFVSGEAGIGKSRMVARLREHLAGTPHHWMNLRGSPYAQQSSLHPLIDAFHSQLGFQAGESEDVRAEKLDRELRDSGLAGTEAVSVLAGFLSLPLPGSFVTPARSAEAQRLKLLEILVSWMSSVAGRRVLVVAVEDAHWLDPSSLELLGLLVDRVPRLPLLLVITARPEFLPPWQPRSHLAHVSLNRLTERQSIQMAIAVAAGSALPVSIVEQIARKTDGVPLFVEEMTRAILDAESPADAPAGDPEIPATLQDLLMSRLDRLGPAKQIAQVGAALGREFSHRLVAAVTGEDETNLADLLDRLLSREILYRRGEPSATRYVFKHALFQDMAYQSMLKKRRIEVHARIGEVLVRDFPDVAGSQPELVAHHWNEAGEKDRAARAWQEAGLRALLRSEVGEAIGHFRKGLDALRVVADASAHVEQEITILNLLGWSTMMNRGFIAPEVGAAHRKARALCRESGSAQIGVTLMGLWAYELNNARYESSREIAEEMLATGQRLGSRTSVLWARIALGHTLLSTGKFAEASAQFNQATALYRVKDQPGAVGGSTDPLVYALSVQALALAWLGFPDRARTQAEAAIKHARRLGHPFSIAWALAYGGVSRHDSGDTVKSRAWAAELIVQAREQRFPNWRGWGHALHGSAESENGNKSRGIVELRHGASLCRQHGGEHFQTLLSGRLAEAQLRNGQLDAATVALDEALAFAQGGESCFLAEIHRLRAELLLAGDSADRQREAEACFGRALEVAREQSARTFELRAATGLARLWQSQDRCREAHDLLAPIHGWFTEGFDTFDQRTAKALMNQLGG